MVHPIDGALSHGRHRLPAYLWTGPLLASGFWLMVSERLIRARRKRRFGQIAGAEALGGLLGGLLAERVAAVWGGPAMLVFLAGFQFVTAWLVWLLATPAGPAAISASADAVSVGPSRSGLRVIAEAPHLHHLVALVLLGSTSAALLEYLFKAKAVETFGPGDPLMRFFALYYAGSSLITFTIQTSSSRAVLERFGLGLTASTPSIALLAGGIGGLLSPGFGSLVVARGAESIPGVGFAPGKAYIADSAAEKRRRPSSTWVRPPGDAVGGGLVRIG